jgi:hypothetical protein
MHHHGTTDRNEQSIQVGFTFATGAGNDRDDQFLGVAADASGGKGRNIGLLHAVKLLKGGFDVVAEVIDSIDDDAVLASPREGEPPGLKEPSITGTEPTVGCERVCGRTGVVEVAARDYGSTQLELTDLAVPQWHAVVINDADLQAVYWQPYRGEFFS